MPKVKSKKERNASGKSIASTRMRAFGPLFNKDLGQHILKNPLVAQGIVDKVCEPNHETFRFLLIDLKQFDSITRVTEVISFHRRHSTVQISCWRSDRVQEI